MEYQTEGRRAGKMVVVTQAVRQERGREVPRGFLAALLRAHTREQSAHTQAAIDKIVAEQVERMREYERKNAEQLRTYHDQRIQKISSLLSDEEVRWMGDESVVRALRFVLKTRLSCEFGGIAGIRDALSGAERKTRDLLEKIERLAPELLPEPNSDESNVLRLAHKR